MRPDAAAEQLARELGAVFVLDGPQVLPAFAPEAAVLLLRQQGPLRISGRPVMGAPVSSAGMEEAELCRLATCLHAGGTRSCLRRKSARSYCRPKVRNNPPTTS